MKTLLVPIDLSDATSKVVGVAAKFAELLEAQLVFLHVVEPKDGYVPLDSTDILAMPRASTCPVNSKESANKLEEAAQPLRQVNHLEVVCKVRGGVAVEEILSEARSCKCEMIVLGSHGHGALYHLFTGGVASGVLKKAQSPVLVVPVREQSSVKSEKCAETSVS